MPPQTGSALLTQRTLFHASRSILPPCARPIPNHAVSSQQKRHLNKPRDSPNKGRSEGNSLFHSKMGSGKSEIGTHRSLLTRNREGMRKNIPNDLGLLPGTLIMPTGSDVPTFFSSPLQRSKLEFGRLKKRARDLISVLMYRSQVKPRLKIHFRKTAPTAAALHRQMYTALADGDARTVHPVLCEGLQAHFATRLASRRPSTRYEWTLHRYTSPPRVVSHRATVLPIDDGSSTKPALRQAVVRIQSVQSLKIVDGRGAAVREMDGSTEQDVHEKEVTEYVVVQKRIWRGVEEAWRVWGTVEETKLEAWEDTMNPGLEKNEPVKTTSVTPVTP